MAPLLRRSDVHAYVLDPLDERRLLGRYALREVVLARGLLTEAELRTGALATFTYGFSLEVTPSTYLHCFLHGRDLIPVLSILDA